MRDPAFKIPLYVVVITMGGVMVRFNPALGALQMLLGAVVLGLVVRRLVQK